MGFWVSVALLLLLLLVSAKGSPRDAWLDILHRLYDQVEHHVGFCFGRDPLDIASAMEESFEFPKQSMSDHVCFNSSVLVKSLCGPEAIEIYYKFMLLTQNPEKIPSTSACPAAEVNKAECLPGFFGYDDEGTKYHPCCDGYFCPRGLNCMIPCPKGSLCLRATPRPPPKRFPQESSSYWCAPFAYKRRMDLPCGGADTWSIIPQDAFPGVESWKYGSGNMYCPKRYFCPNTTTKLACPRGHYCKQGSVAPQPCPIGSFCPEKTEVPLSNYGGVSADVLLLLLLAIIWFVSKQYSQIMSNITHQDRLRIRWKPFPPRLHVAPKKHHRIEFDTAVPISSDDISDSHASSYGDGDADIDVAFFHTSMELVSHTRKVLLSDVSGRFEKRSVTAILGPSGAGKSSLLSLLAGRASSYAVQTSGHIFVNGKEDNMHTLRGNLGYVPQDDIMFSTLTVKENLLYAARFGMKRSSTWEDHQRAVFETISLLHLQSVQNELVGDPSSKYGISGGQKKRVNIGLEMVQKPKVLFLDEPTSGLDSSSAFSLIQSLREIATEKRVTTCAVLHQPRNECFYLCDNVLLMASGGTSVYYGKTHSVEKHFEALGFQLPIHTNPADFIVDIISTKDIDFGICMDELLLEYRHEYPESAMILPLASWSHDDHEEQVTAAGEEYPTMYYSDENENISVLRDTSIISKVLKAFAITFASLELKAPLLGRRTDHDDSNRQIGFFRQAYWFIQRAGLHRTREPLEAMADYIMVVLTGLTVGLLSDRGKSTIMSYASQVSYAVVALGLIATVSTTTTFTTHALMIKREHQSSGISKLAYFVALDAFDMIGSCIKSILFLAGWASFASPRATWTYLYLVTVFIFYSCAGISYALSLYLGESSSQLAAAIITLISTLVARQPDPGILMILLQSISFPRFAMEGFLIAESNQLKGVWLLARCADLKLLNYDVRNFYIDLVALFLLGVGLRIIALEKLLRM